jgi:N-acetylmuramic acid 6-phosphate etherase
VNGLQAALFVAAFHERPQIHEQPFAAYASEARSRKFLEIVPIPRIMARMNGEATLPRRPLYLGIEAGGTRTVALLEDGQGRSVAQHEAGPANLRLLDDGQLARHFRGIARALPKPDALAIGMAGARTEADWARIRRAAARAWPGIPCYATNDLETALMAAEEVRPKPARAGRKATQPATRNPQPALPRVLVLSGTGSCCFGRTQDGKTVKFGGWGHVLGDKGSGYEIGLRALKAVVYYLDRDGEWSALGGRLLRALQLNEPNDLIPWAQNATKTQIAALAVEVFKAWSRRDGIASDILAGASESLAKDAAHCARRLAGRNVPVQFVFAGSLLLKQPRFARKVEQKLKRLWKNAVVSPLRRASVSGAVALARRHFPPAEKSPLVQRRPEGRKASGPAAPSSAALSPTEQRHPRSMNLDKLSLRAAIRLMLDEDAKIPRALLDQQRQIERGVQLIVRSFQRGGRLFYVGAGTSGRLGVLDASECPPTFRTDPEMVQGIIAGGQTALWQAVEGAEDDPEAGARAIVFRRAYRRDTVVGIAASGRTPFVWGALREAKRRGASTILICFNPHLVIPRADRPALVIAPRIGPEILTGSTRLKSGTATKLILNIFTTLAMARMGKVLGNLMIDVKASNTKLRDRAVRIVRELTGADYPKAEAALVQCDWKIKPACARLGRR